MNISIMSSLIDGTIVALGVAGVMLFISALAAFEVPLTTEKGHNEATSLDNALKQAA